MAAFAQFSSDLDKETLKIIERGKRMVEALKQAPNQPIAFEKQAALMYAGGKGFLDKIAVEDVLEFEKKLYEKLDTSYVSFADQVRVEAKMTDEVKETFEKIAQEVVDEMKL